MTDEQVTREFRRYAMIPELFDEFLAWYRAGVPAFRAKHGFTIEWCVVDREHLHFDWIVSHPGTEEDFRAAEQALETSPEWTAYLAQIPPSLTGLEKSFVEVFTP